MNPRSLILSVGLVLILTLAACGDSVNYDKTKQKAGETTKEYLLTVRGMT